tara:strand:- start:292 stop:474 length:183 start_codon:yes stop_codon:yes gene_type:complete
MISKQRINLFKKLGFYLFLNTQTLEDLKHNKELLKLSKSLTNKEIKEIISKQEADYYLPF